MATYSVEQQNTAITTATTTTVLSALASADDEARVKPGMLTCRNKGADSNTLTIIKNDGTQYEITAVTLGAGEEWVNPWDTAITGTGTTLQITTSSTSAIDVCVSFIKKVA